MKPVQTALRQILTKQGSAVTPLGLAAYDKQDPQCVRAAHAAGINLFFFYDLSYQPFLDELVAIAATDRENLIIAAGSSERTQAGLEQDLTATLQALNTDYLDVYLAEYVSPADDPAMLWSAAGVVQQLQHLKARGLIRYAGVSTHNRELALQFIERQSVDVIMHRYNMAHRKAEETVFPAAIAADLPVWAFTATRWGTLLQGHRHWQASPPSAADCYRYCLSHPAVQTVLAAPLTFTELQENLIALSALGLNEAELETWRRYGDLIYGDGNHSFETHWL